jgi:hypothetical protein
MDQHVVPEQTLYMTPQTTGQPHVTGQQPVYVTAPRAATLAPAYEKTVPAAATVVHSGSDDAGDTLDAAAAGGAATESLHLRGGCDPASCSLACCCCTVM